jgi:hypothetical protein
MFTDGLCAGPVKFDSRVINLGNGAMTVGPALSTDKPSTEEVVCCGLVAEQAIDQQSGDTTPQHLAPTCVDGAKNRAVSLGESAA